MAKGNEPRHNPGDRIDVYYKYEKGIAVARGVFLGIEEKVLRMDVEKLGKLESGKVAFDTDARFRNYPIDRSGIIRVEAVK